MPARTADLALRAPLKIANDESQNRAIVYLDESGFAKGMPRTHEYGGKGKRCYGTDDCHAKGRTHVIGAIIGFTFLRVALFEGNINGDVFYAWLVQELLPVLPDRTVIVMDNASFHKREDRVAAIKQGDHELEYLPPYSPDLNPIEKKWAQAKAIGKQDRCDVEMLFTEHMNYDKL